MSKIMTFFTLLGVVTRILFVDIGSYFTAWKYKYPEIQISSEGTIRENNPILHADKIIQIIKDYQVNYLITEREIEEHLPNRPDPYFKNYLSILKKVINYCHTNNIKGCAILTRTKRETRKQRELKNYCWRENWTTNEYYCYAHKTNENNKVKTLDEVDIQCFQEIFSNLPPELLKVRGDIFNSPIIIKEVANYPNQETKTQRLNIYQQRQNAHQ